MNASKDNGHRPDVQTTSDTRTLKLLAVGSVQGSLSQTTVTTTEQWLGLTYNDAKSLLTSYEQSVLGSTTRNYLGGVKMSVGSSASVLTWVTIEGCWGTRVTTSYSKMGDTSLYQVQRQTTTMTLTSSGCELTYL